LTTLAGLALASLLSGCDNKPPEAAALPKPSFKGVDITGANYAQALNLPDTEGRNRSLADFKGKVLVVFFGYTQCPDVCPTTMTELAAVKKQLGPDGDRVQGIFVTVDPERDTPALLKQYMDAFNAGFVALRGTPDQIKATAKDFKVFYAKVPGRTDDSYTVDHTAGSYLFDANGHVRVFTRYGAGAEALTQDLKILLAEPAAKAG
jgi:protein SCO1/2